MCWDERWGVRWRGGGVVYGAYNNWGGGLTMAPPSQLYDALWEDNERLKEQLQEAELKVTQLRLELERVTQVGGEGEARGGGRGGGSHLQILDAPPLIVLFTPPLLPSFTEAGAHRRAAGAAGVGALCEWGGTPPK